MDMAIPIFENQKTAWKPIVVAGLLGVATYFLIKFYRVGLPRFVPKPPKVEYVSLKSEIVGLEMFSGPMPFDVKGGILVSDVINKVQN